MVINIDAKKIVAEPGQEEWTTSSGTFTWMVPNGVYSICAVAIGGGGGGAASPTAPAAGGSGGDLVYGNVISVTPGEKLTIVVGNGGDAAVSTAGNGSAGEESYVARGATRLISAPGGGGGTIGISVTTGKNGTATLSGSSMFPGSSYSVDTGLGGISTTTSATSSERCSGGGGAGGWGNGATDLGSNGVNSTGTSTSSTTGGGSGGTGGATGVFGGGGGGTGPWGLGSNGAGITGVGLSGIGGSGGNHLTSEPTIIFRIPSSWSAGGVPQNGGLFGGGGGGGINTAAGTGGGFGSRGCVRIIWGDGREFPSRRAGNMRNANGSTTIVSSQQNYTSPGTYTWIVPAGVNLFSAVCIGGGGAGQQSVGAIVGGRAGGAGGGLAWASFPCSPGESFTIITGNGGYSTGQDVIVAAETSKITRNVSFKGFIEGTSLHITQIISGYITTGLTISGSGATTTSISAFQTGEYGKIGTYTVSITQTSGSLQSPITFSGSLELMSASGGGTGTHTAASTGGTGTVHTASARGGTGAYTGGAGGIGNNASINNRGAGGGGAAGYGGAGGIGGASSSGQNNGGYPATTSPSVFPGAGSGGANGGASSGSSGAGGGGVGIYGWGKDPNIDNFTTAAGPSITGSGFGGSGGGNGDNQGSSGGFGNGGSYGGGAGADNDGFLSSSYCRGGDGAVRITWGRMPYPGPTVDV